MKKGGYKIIDFKGTALSGTAVELSGIYDQIVDDYNKPIMVSGVTISGELQDDAYASVKVDDNSVSLTVYGGVITVTEDDEVTFAIAKSNAELTTDVARLINNSVALKTDLTDANDAETGWYYGGAATLNFPTAAAYFLISISMSTHKAQLAINRTSGNLYSRSNSSGTWTVWKLATNE